MHKYKVIFFLLTVLLLANCNRNDNMLISKETISSIKISEKHCRDSPSNDKKICDEMKIATIEFLHNVALNNYIYQFITGEKDFLGTENLSDKLLIYVENYFKAESDYEDDHYIFINFNLIGLAEQLAYFCYQEEVFIGGVHPEYGEKNLVLDLNSLQEVKLATILKDSNSQGKLFDLQKNALLNYYKEVLGETEEQAKEILESFNVTFSTNWGLTEDGIVFTYSPYEAGPYSFGIIEITIPHNKLNEIIKPQYLNLIKAWKKIAV